MNVPCDLAQFRSLGLSAERMPGTFNLGNMGADALRRDTGLRLRRPGGGPVEAWAADARGGAGHRVRLQSILTRKRSREGTGWRIKKADD
jgi:hypothetical protein